MTQHCKKWELQWIWGSIGWTDSALASTPLSDLNKWPELLNFASSNGKEIPSYILEYQSTWNTRESWQESRDSQTTGNGKNLGNSSGCLKTEVRIWSNKECVPIYNNEMILCEILSIFLCCGLMTVYREVVSANWWSQNRDVDVVISLLNFLPSLLNTMKILFFEIKY